MLQGATEAGLGRPRQAAPCWCSPTASERPSVRPASCRRPGRSASRTYAIGFGLPQDINVQVLNVVTSNTHGDLIITGDISTEERGFSLTAKYFVQVLAGVVAVGRAARPAGRPAGRLQARDPVPGDRRRRLPPTSSRSARCRRSWTSPDYPVGRRDHTRLGRQQRLFR